jgi:hypothetical protein
MFVMEESFEPTNAFAWGAEAWSKRVGLDNAKVDDELVRFLVSFVLKLDVEIKCLQNRLNILEGRPE